jgi:hypothetical protein
LVERIADTPLRNSIDIFDQTPSQDSARQASANGLRATIDLSSASDRLSCALVQRVFRRNLSLLSLMKACRTRYLSNTIDRKSPGLIKLRKFASMGSALTFPVQSIVFAMLAIGVGVHLSRERGPVTANLVAKCSKQVRVYGDDIIVPVEWVESLYGVLDAMGLKVNLSKSFSRGFFRESCGFDGYKGHDVTPVFIRTFNIASNTRSVDSTVITSNNAFLRGYWRLAESIMKTVLPYAAKYKVVNHKASAYGFASYCTDLDPRMKVRWNEDLQREEVLVHRILPVALEHFSVESPRNYLEYFVNALRRDKVPDWKRILASVSVQRGLGEVILPDREDAARVRRSWVPVMDLSS